MFADLSEVGGQDSAEPVTNGNHANTIKLRRFDVKEVVDAVVRTTFDILKQRIRTARTERAAHRRGERTECVSLHRNRARNEALERRTPKRA